MSSPSHINARWQACFGKACLAKVSSCVLDVGEGLHGEQGVRRSSRSKHAPLEYWRNERKVYNREFRSKRQNSLEQLYHSGHEFVYCRQSSRHAFVLDS